jgi:ankyrin repeat protein
MIKLINIIENPSNVDNSIIFNLIKTNETNKIINMIETNKLTDLNIKDENNNYFIHYIINYNNINLLKVCLKKNINLQVLDNDKRTILFNIVKFNYIDMLKILIEYNNKLIGMSVLDIKDKFGLTILHYTIISNNYDIFKILLENNVNPYINDNKNNNSITYTIMNNRNEMLKYFINNNYKLNIISDKNETLLHIALNYKNAYAIQLLLNSTIDLNTKDTENGFTILHLSILQNDIDLFTKLINLNIQYNLQDYYGNTAIHYIFIEKKYNFLDKLVEKIKNNIIKLEYDYTNYNGDTILHLLLENKIYDYNNEYTELFITNTDLNIMNNNGITCLLLLYNNNLLDTYKNILIYKPLNFYIKDHDNNMINITNYTDIIVESYYNQLISNKDKLKSDNWEAYCANNILDKLKKISKFTNIEDICKNKIKELVLKEKRSLPQLINLDLKLDNGIFVNTCYYTGFPIDILFGLLVLYQNFSDLGLILDYPLIVNKKLQEHYTTNGTDYFYKLDFSNIEIIWSYQKIFYPSYFDEIVKKQLKEKKYIVIPIGIEMSNGSHANILFWDIHNKTIERFEPNGANSPIGFNYNNNLLDSLLKAKFQKYDPDIKYYSPNKFLPAIGFQILENVESNKCTRIGDPNGFCGVWSIWWVYQRILNINNKQLNINNIANELIKYIKYDGLKFKNIIRNFSSKITELRDMFLKKYNLDINDWINNNYSQSDLENLEKDIFKLL